MKNPFLSRLNQLDQIYPSIIKMPNPAKKAVAKTVSMYLNRKLSNNHMMDRMTVIVTDVCNLTCAHCFISTTEREKRAWEMGLEEYEKFFSNLHLYIEFFFISFALRKLAGNANLPLLSNLNLHIVTI